MSDERRRWKIVRRRDWFHGLGHIHPFDEAPQADAELEVIEVMPVAEHEAALARVERGWDEAREEAATISDALGAMTDERDALRAQVEALTGEQAVEAAAKVITGPPACYCPDDWRQPYDKRRCPMHGEAAWPPAPRLKLATAALAAARDAAAAKTPDQTPTEETS